MRTSSIVAAAVVLAAAAPAWGADDAPPAAVARAGAAERGGPGLWQVSAGLRVGHVSDPGFDPFSATDMLPAFSVQATRALTSSRHLGFSPAVGLVGEIGGATALARAAHAELDTWRLGVAFEARYAPFPEAYFVLRAVPAVQLLSVELRDSSAPAPLDGDLWSSRAFTFDASLGAAVRLTRPTTKVGFWILSDAGYGFAPRRDLVVRPALAEADKPKAGATSLGSLDLSGIFMRFSAALSY